MIHLSSTRVKWFNQFCWYIKVNLISSSCSWNEIVWIHHIVSITLIYIFIESYVVDINFIVLFFLHKLSLLLLLNLVIIIFLRT